MQSARWFLKLAPDDAKPSNALTMIAVFPLFSPNSVPSVVSLSMGLPDMHFVYLMSSPQGHLMQPNSGNSD